MIPYNLDLRGYGEGIFHGNRIPVYPVPRNTARESKSRLVWISPNYMHVDQVDMSDFNLPHMISMGNKKLIGVHNRYSCGVFGGLTGQTHRLKYLQHKRNMKIQNTSEPWNLCS